MEQQRTSEILRFDAYEMDLLAGEIRINGQRVKLQEQPFRILAILLHQPGQVITREALREKLWPADTFVDFDHSLNTAIKKLRQALNDEAEKPHFIETLPRRGYRYIGPAVEARLAPQGMNLKDSDSAPRIPQPENEEKPAGAIVGPRTQIIRSWILGLLTIALLLGGAGYFFHSRTPVLTEKDTLLLADFANSTGDPVFDGTLREGLAVQLEQSPFLSLVSSERIQQTLPLMGQTRDARLTPEIARQLCQRTAGKAVLEGSIASIGVEYILIVKAVDCSTGETVASSEAEASDKNHVLAALGKVSSEIRRKLGESLASVRKFDTPLEQATTPSLEALQAYSRGFQEVIDEDDPSAAVLPLQRATSLDPHFAMAYSLLGKVYSEMGETTKASENSRMAYDLRAGISEREKFYVESHYYHYGTGDLEKARRIYDAWAQAYPRDYSPPANLAVICEALGEDDKALEQNLRLIRVLPESGLPYANAAFFYLYLNRFDDAREMVKQAHTKNLDVATLHAVQYWIAFFEKDRPKMEAEVTWAQGKPDMEATLLSYEFATSAYTGRLARAREFMRSAVRAAERDNESEAAAWYLASAAQTFALFGNSAEARKSATDAVARSTGRDVQVGSALALALTGDVVRAEAVAHGIAARFPDDTIVHRIHLPILHAQIALARHEPQEAIQALQPTLPFEPGGSLYPASVRGASYLAMNRGIEAGAEFRKIVENPGLRLADPIGPLALLGVARAYAVQGDKVKARAAYQDFLTLWKEADPDIPILIAAKSEYAKLQ